MFRKRVPSRWVALVLLVAVCSLGGLIASCAPAPPLPEDAQEALISYWESLPSASKIKHRIIRAWPGAPATDESGNIELPREIWCVETEITFAENLEVVGEHTTWIVFREHANEGWTAFFLAAMSSMWPYEACQGN